MGIKNLTQLIKNNSPNSIQHVGLYTLKNKRIAIDTSIFIYRSLINIRYNGDYLRNKDNKIISHIQGLYYKTIQYLSLGIIPIYIFDGKPPHEKNECIQGRIKKANDCKEKLKITENDEDKITLEKGSIRIKKEYIEDLKYLFNIMGVSYIQADGEAEAYASELCRTGFVDAVVMFSEETPYNLISTLLPNILAKGGDYKITEIAGHDVVQGNGGKVVLVPFIDGFSSNYGTDSRTFPPDIQLKLNICHHSECIFNFFPFTTAVNI